MGSSSLGLLGALLAMLALLYVWWRLLLHPVAALRDRNQDEITPPARN
jgi:hypothetical protein